MNSRFVASLAIAICSYSVAAFASEPPITSLAFAPGGKSVVACSQAGLRVFSWPELKPQRKLKVSAPSLHDLAFSPDGARLAVAGGAPAEKGTIEILAWPAGDSLKVLEGHGDSVMAVVWQNDASMASASLDHTVMIWNTETGARIRTLKGHSRGVTALCFLKKPNMLVSAGIDQSLRVWKGETGALVRSMAIHIKPVNSVAWRAAGEGLPLVASASEDRTVRIWQPTIGRMVRFARLKAKPLDIAWLPDGSRIVAGCADGQVYVIDPDTVKVTREFPALNGWAYALAAHPNGAVVVGGQGGEIKRLEPTGSE